MSSAREPMRLTSKDLYAPQVNEYLEHQKFLRRDVPEEQPRSWIVRVVYSSCFYLSLAAGLGAFVAWALVEPFFDDSAIAEQRFNLANLLMFPTVTAFIGLFLGAAEGMICRNSQRAVISAAVGLGVGFGGGLVLSIAGSFIYMIMIAVAANIMQGNHPMGRPRGIPFLILMMGRSAAWALTGISAGIGQGIALREKKVALNGLLGGVLGGLVGGLLFDPIDVAFTGDDREAGLSRAVGFTVIGLFVGLFVGIVEQWTKTAWLLMKAGPLAGKQFILYRNPTVLGSSPKADIYLFKDDAIEPRHALIHNRGGRYEIEDLNTPDGTYVNGIPVQKRVLQTGDQVVLGKTVLEFTLRTSK